MALLFRRAISLTLGTKLVTNLRVVFKVKRSLKQEPNTIEAQVYNLAPDTLAALAAAKPRPALLLEAGYKDSVQQLFVGKVREARSVRQGVDVITTVQGGDGERELSRARVNLSFRPGTPVGTVLDQLGQALGVNVQKAKGLLQSAQLRGGLAQFTTGTVVSGKAADEFWKLLTGAGLEASVQDGELQVMPRGQPSLLPVVKLAADSGLVGTPELGERGRLKARSLLQGQLLPGRQVYVYSPIAKVDGYYRITEVVHSGDTDGAAWYSDIEGTPI